MAVTIDQVRALLESQLQPESLQVTDDSEAHVGHADAGEGTHFTVHICASVFKGRSVIARHRLVYDALHPLMAQGIHALAIHAQVPSA